MPLPNNPLNPGPAWTPNHVQPNTAGPAPGATIIPVANVNLLAPLPVPVPKFVQPDPPPKPNHAAFPLGDGKG